MPNSLSFKFPNVAIRFVVLSVFCLLLSLLSPVRIYGQADEVSRSWNQPVKPYRVIGNIYYVGASDVTSFLIVTPKGHILLDSGFFETVPQIKQNIAQLGFRLEDVKFLITSHAHYDHAGGLALLKEMTGAKLMASQADSELLARGGKSDPNFGDRYLYPPVTADRILHDGDSVELGDVKMIAHLTPGHTKGCTTWTMKVKEGSRQYDVVFVGSTSAPGYKLVDNPQYPTIVEDYERTFRLLKSLPCDVFLAAHGFFFSMQEKAKLLAQGEKQNPFIDKGGYRRYLAESEKAFRDELTRQAKQTTEKIYEPKEVDRKAKITKRSEPPYTEKARKNRTSGSVVLRVVLKSTGEIGDITVIRNLPDGLTEECIRVTREVKFEPAMKDGIPVSQYARVEYSFTADW